MFQIPAGLRARGRRQFGGRPLVVALLIRTRDHRSILQEFLHQIFAAATRALFGNRPVRRSELALGIISAPVERVAFAGALLHQIALFALRTLYPNIVLLHVLAFGISAASRKLAEAFMPDHHIPPALR